MGFSFLHEPYQKNENCGGYPRRIETGNAIRNGDPTTVNYQITDSLTVDYEITDVRRQIDRDSAPCLRSTAERTRLVI